MTVTWHVYQFRSETGGLLYVGYTRWLNRRIGQHRRGKSWWPEVTDIQSEEFAAEDEARLREKEIWADERPKYNRQSPFVTPEELRQQGRLYEMTPEARERTRERKKALRATPEHREAERMRDRTPERQQRKRTPQYRAQKRAYNREYYWRRPARRWGRQTGPGLF